MQSRWYSPGTGTFRSRDSFAGHLNTPVSLNRYTYAGNNPIRYSDPSGRCYEIWAPGCTAAIATAGVNFPGLRVTEVDAADNTSTGELAVSLENGLHVASLGFDSGGQPTTAGVPFWVDQPDVPANNTHFDFEVATSGSEADQLFVEHRTKCAKSGSLTDPSCGAVYELANEASVASVASAFGQRCSAAVWNCFNARGDAETDAVVMAVIEEAVTLGVLKAFRGFRASYAGIRAGRAARGVSHGVDNAIAQLDDLWSVGSGLRGSGPVPGVLEASPRVQSVAAINNHPGGVEYAFDTTTGVFALGKPAPFAVPTAFFSPHQRLAAAIGADGTTVGGGIARRGDDGLLYLDEMSGHYWRNWTDASRAQIRDALNGYGVRLGP